MNYLKTILLTIFILFNISGGYFTLATNYYVNDNSVTGDIFCTAVGNNSNNGTTSATPKATLTNLWTTYGPLGTNVLTSGDSIKIDAGTYTTDINLNISVAGLVFLGAGLGITVFDNNLAGTNTNYFMYINNSNITIKNLTIKKYENQGNQTPGTSGQSITIGGTVGTPASVTLENTAIQDNGQSGGNASITILPYSTVLLKGGGSLCNTEGTSYSGGVDILGANITLTVQNYALTYNTKGAYYGGGLYIVGNNATTTVLINNSLISNNIATEGGSIYLNGGNLSVVDCTFDNNTYNAGNGGIYGGCITIKKGIAKISRSKFTNNIGGKGGAIAVYSINGSVSLTLDSCSFSGNSAVSGRGVDLYARPSASYTSTISGTQNSFSSSTSSICNYDGSGNPCPTISLTNSGSPSTTYSQCSVTLSGGVSTYTPNPSVPSVSGTCGSIILPVELIDFKGFCLKNKIELYWQTASETNNDYFIIEKSSNGISFNEIGKVFGSGNSNILNSYSFCDAEILNTSNFYRLTQVDFDGKMSMSNVIFVSNICNITEFSLNTVYYAPENQEILLDIISIRAGFVNITVTDLLGRKVIVDNIEIHEGMNSFNIPANSLNESIYIVTVNNDKNANHRKIYLNK